MADNRWLGKALNVTQVDTITVAGVWANGDTATVTIGGFNLTVTIGDLVTTADVAEALSAAFNASSATVGLIGSGAGAESRNVGGQQIPAFQELSATFSGAVVTITHAVTGTPFTLTTSEVTADTGSLTEATSTAATGENFLDNADNWSDGIPTADDVLIFDSGGVSLKYNLTYLRTNTIETSFRRTTDYTGEIGLPAENPRGYREYRTRQLQLYNATADKDIEFNAGVAGGTGGITRIDCDGQTFQRLIVGDPGKIVQNVPNVEISGGTMDFWHARGFLYIDPPDALPSSPFEITTGDNPVIGAAGVPSNEMMLHIGEGQHVTGSSAVVVYGGRIVNHGALAWGGIDLIIVNINNATWTQEGDGNIDSVVCKTGGKFIWKGSGTAATGPQIHARGEFDQSQTTKTQTLTTAPIMGAGSTLRVNVEPSSITYTYCVRDDVKIIIGAQ